MANVLHSVDPFRSAIMLKRPVVQTIPYVCLIFLWKWGVSSMRALRPLMKWPPLVQLEVKLCGIGGIVVVSFFVNESPSTILDQPNCSICTWIRLSRRLVLDPVLCGQTQSRAQCSANMSWTLTLGELRRTRYIVSAITYSVKGMVLVEFISKAASPDKRLTEHPCCSPLVTHIPNLFKVACL